MRWLRKLLDDQIKGLGKQLEDDEVKESLMHLYYVDPARAVDSIEQLVDEYASQSIDLGFYLGIFATLAMIKSNLERPEDNNNDGQLLN